MIGVWGRGMRDLCALEVAGCMYIYRVPSIYAALYKRHCTIVYVYCYDTHRLAIFANITNIAGSLNLLYQQPRYFSSYCRASDIVFHVLFYTCPNIFLSFCPPPQYT
ncbi:hypothetical protein FKM82_023067 [Ascaphus truei]